MKSLKPSFPTPLLAAVLFVSVAGNVHADETLKEKAKARAHDVERGAKKGGHRVKEAITCAKSDVDCAAEKIKNRAREGHDALKDSSSELKDKAD